MPTSDTHSTPRASRPQPRRCKTSDLAPLRYLSALTLAILLTATLLACTGENEDPATNERITELETRARALEQSLQALADENADLKTQIATFRDRLTERDARIRQLEQAASKAQTAFPDKEQWSKDKWLSSDADPVSRTAGMIEDAGGQVHYITHPERGDRTVLALPRRFDDGQTPLIVSLHGFGGNSAHQIAYVPLHERMNSDRFALLLPNGTPDADGNRSWNPTDDPFTKNSGDTPQDDVAYLTELIAQARKIADFGPIYLFGYSNGGFMAYHIACKGLPGLRAVASLSGASYVQDSACEGASPVSILHIHGTQDNVILYDGDRSQPDPKTGDQTAFYASAQDMITRWSQRAGCPWPADPQPYTTLDLDQSVPGEETKLFRSESPCPNQITIELWKSENSGHAPAYGPAFRDALLSWLLSQN